MGNYNVNCNFLSMKRKITKKCNHKWNRTSSSVIGQYSAMAYRVGDEVVISTSCKNCGLIKIKRVSS